MIISDLEYLEVATCSEKENFVVGGLALAFSHFKVQAKNTARVFTRAWGMTNTLAF